MGLATAAESAEWRPDACGRPSLRCLFPAHHHPFPDFGKAMASLLWFSQESLTPLKFRDALAQIMKEIREFHGLRQILGMKIGS